MKQRNDQIFQLSLTEIAFTITFVLLLLLGYLISLQQQQLDGDRKAVAQAKAIQQRARDIAQAKEALDKALTDAGAGNPEEALTRLIAAEEMRRERDRLKQRIEELEEQITALTELKSILDRSTGAEPGAAAQREIAAALALQADIRKMLDQFQAATGAPADSSREAVRAALGTAVAVRKAIKSQLGEDVSPGAEAVAITQLIDSAQQSRSIKSNLAVADKVNADLRGQVAFLRNRLEARGGRDYPPCWADEKGKVEFLLNVDLKPDVIEVTPGWPSNREADALALPGILEVLGAPAPLETFQSRIQGIFQWSRRHDPECRHFVRLRSQISDAVQSDRARLAIENYFYKSEIRR